MAPDVPSAGMHFDYGLSSFDIRNIFHFNEGYELPSEKVNHPWPIPEESPMRYSVVGAETGQLSFKVASRLP